MAQDPEFCYWNPTDAACQDIYAKAEPLYISAAPTFTKGEVVFANITFLLIAGVEGAINGMVPFYYRNRSWDTTDDKIGFYDGYEGIMGNDSTNWWKIASMVK